jgi:hypothetical protein
MDCHGALTRNEAIERYLQPFLTMRSGGGRSGASTIARLMPDFVRMSCFLDMAG